MADSEPSRINFIPCLKWIRRGVASSNPIKVELSKEELKDLINNTGKKLKLSNHGEDEDEDEDENENENENENVDDTVLQRSTTDEYGFSYYDDESDIVLNIGDLAMFNGPYTVDDDEVDSDAEDDLIKEDDNLIVVGHVEGLLSSLEVYVHNLNENSLYVHHDIILPSIPLCIEWLNYDPKDVNRAANLCAVGSMSPVIDIWDIDLMNSIEPIYKLGRRGSTAKSKPQVGHKEAVLDLSWNTELTHILASGSADKTIILWDLANKKPHTTLTSFQNNVQTLEWHPFEAQTLLAGSSDRTSKVFDCRTEDSFKSWILEDEVERVLWNHFNPFQFLCADAKGHVYAFDRRQDNPIWEIAAHSKEVTGLALSPQCPGFLGTASQDGAYKVWDIIGDLPEIVFEKSLNIGSIQCLEVAPDDPFLLASGGDNRNRNLLVFSANGSSAVQSRFRSREFVPVRTIEGTRPSTSEPSRIHPVMKKDERVKKNSLKIVKKKKVFKKYA